MSDSSARDSLKEKHERNRQQRIVAIKRWVEYIETHDADEWGEQQNPLIDSQLESARQSDISVEHRRRVAKAGRDCSK
ncbi:hypothetical protein [Halovivax limisalsi]|uniref:hypothetical protein n=1 Tax=Halovivax limisalsi TaxID=1453760 RepID=UPI001FFD0361|nr:hypothetical protein [Halovivax limisalsi]